MIRRLRIYLAGPLFNEWERRRKKELRDALAVVADVFLPQEDGALLVDLLAEGVSYTEARGRVFAADMRAIQECDLLIALLDGRTIDEGVAFELGAAYAMGKICWGLKSDQRALLKTGDNPMVECALTRLFQHDDELLPAVVTFGEPGSVTKSDVRTR